MKKYILILIFTVILTSCSDDNARSDAYGTFEADEILLSAEAPGKIIMLNIDEGDRIEKGDLIAVIDTTQLHLKKLQLLAGINTVSSKTRDISSQIEVLETRKSNLLREKARIERLYRDSAATLKQFEDISGEVEYIEKQITAQRTALQDANRGILSEKDPLHIQIMQIEDQIEKSIIYADFSGTVISKYVNQGEYTMPGKPLIKIADLDYVYLRVYISGDMLSSIKIGSEAEVLIDAQDDTMLKYKGIVSWISSKAEFTPKIIQTRQERVNLVYATKIKVKNDGKIKIGMPGEALLK
jgi:HlyD family secretion protein